MEKRLEVSVNNLTDMKRFAEALAKTWKGGERIGLVGPLGAGKTTLVGFMHAALGGLGEVDSPTFTLRQTYPVTGQLTIEEIVHYDLYRLREGDEDALAELGIADDWAKPTNLILLEWADRFPELVETYLTHLVTIDWNPETDGRTVRLAAL